MASFDKSTTPVLSFRLPWVDWENPPGPRWLFWPVLAWRTVAPRPRQRRLNVLQKAVLGLCRSGRGTGALPDQLKLGADLVAFIVSELKQLSWLDGRGAVTPAGIKVLESEQAEPSDEQIVGWVFSDPFTGEVWPRFVVADLPYAETELNEKGYPRIVGTRGTGRNIDGHSVVPRTSEVMNQKPCPEDVVRACRAHRRQYGWQSELLAEDAPSVERVSFVSAEASAFFVATRGWRGRDAEWHVDDPFGIGESVRLRRQIEERFDTNEALRKWLAPVAGGGIADSDLESLHMRAKWDVETRVSSALVHRLPQLGERLVAMQRAVLEVELDASPADKWDDVAVKAQKAAERALLEITNAWAPRARLSRFDSKTNEELLAMIAGDLGFTAPLPASLIKVKTGKIHAAMEWGGGLRPLALLGLLGTPGCPEHPYVQAAAKAPDLLHRIDALARVRDEAGHEFRATRNKGLDHADFQAEVRQGVETVFDLVQHLCS